MSLIVGFNHFVSPRFADILGDMSEEVGVQAILISHHQDASFTSLPDRMRLEKMTRVLFKLKEWENKSGLMIIKWAY